MDDRARHALAISPSVLISNVISTRQRATRPATRQRRAFACRLQSFDSIVVGPIAGNASRAESRRAATMRVSAHFGCGGPLPVVVAPVRSSSSIEMPRHDTMANSRSKRRAKAITCSANSPSTVKGMYSPNANRSALSRRAAKQFDVIQSLMSGSGQRALNSRATSCTSRSRGRSAVCSSGRGGSRSRRGGDCPDRPG